MACSSPRDAASGFSGWAGTTPIQLVAPSHHEPYQGTRRRRYPLTPWYHVERQFRAGEQERGYSQAKIPKFSVPLGLACEFTSFNFVVCTDRWRTGSENRADPEAPFPVELEKSKARGRVSIVFESSQVHQRKSEW